MINPQNVVTAMADAMSYAETIQRDQKIPVPATPKGLNRTEKVLFEMLIENTGCHILDSGGAYGRC